MFVLNAISLYGQTARSHEMGVHVKNDKINWPTIARVMRCNSGKSFSAALVSQILQTLFHWLFYDRGFFLQVVIKKLTKCRSQKLINHLVLADKIESLQTNSFSVFFFSFFGFFFFQVESKFGSLSFVCMESEFC